MIEPYYSDGRCQLYLGDMREILPALGQTFNAACIDPPYGETSLKWDRWVEDWPTLVAAVTTSMWCFGSMRMFLDHGTEFTEPGWKFSQDIVWEKHNGSSFANDRFKRVHEHATHWSIGAWSEQHHEVPTTADATARTTRRKGRPTHTGNIGNGPYTSEDGGPRLMRSVLQVRSMHGHALHPTEKPSGLLIPMISYSCPIGGTVLDPFAGSGSTLAAAKSIGRRAVGIEGDEKYAEIAAKRLCQDALDFDEAGAA
jgi:site-specific DNA-methyltransferase (adenine-specific)